MVNVQQPDLLALTIYVILIVIFPIGVVVGGKIVGPSKPTPTKNMSFECGQPPSGEAHLRFNIQYYPYAMIYAIFGAIAIFLFLTAPAIIGLPSEVSAFFVLSLTIIILSLVGAVISLRSTKWR